MRFLYLTGLMFLVAVGFAGCGGAPVEKAKPAPVPAQPSVPVSAKGERIRHSLQSREVAEIWNAAEEARSVGEYEKAADLLKSALQQAPEDAALWSRLAELMLRTDQDVLAENYAAKSNVFAQENTALKYRNWLIIYHARDKRGDSVGARKAEMKAAEYRYPR